MVLLGNIDQGRRSRALGRAEVSSSFRLAKKSRLSFDLGKPYIYCYCYKFYLGETEWDFANIVEFAE